MLWREDKTLGKLLSCVQLFATPWTVAYQAPPSMGFSKWLRLRAYSTGDTASIPRGIEIGRSPITFTLWTILIKYFSASIKKKKEHWSGLPFSSPGDLPDPGIKPESSPLQADSLPSEPPGNTRVQSLGREDLLEKEMATHSSILAWKIPWTEEPGRLQFMGSQRVRHDWVTSLSLEERIRHYCAYDTGLGGGIGC